MSGMAVRIIDRQPLGNGGEVEILVRRDERHRVKTGILVTPLDIEDNRELHGIIGPEPVFASNNHRIAEEDRSKLDDAITLDEMAAEMA